MNKKNKKVLKNEVKKKVKSYRKNLVGEGEGEGDFKDLYVFPP